MKIGRSIFNQKNKDDQESILYAKKINIEYYPNDGYRDWEYEIKCPNCEKNLATLVLNHWQENCIKCPFCNKRFTGIKFI